MTSPWTALLAVLLAGAPVGGQITVRVMDGVGGGPVPLAVVEAWSEGGRRLEIGSTGADGVVLLRSAAAARYLRVSALGYHPTEVEIGDSTWVEVSIEPAALELDSIRVDVSHEGPTPGRLSWTRRRASEDGIFLDPADIARKTEYGIHMAFGELPGIRRTRFGSGGIPEIVSSRGSGCMRYQLNGLRRSIARLDDWPLSSLLPEDVVAMEIYPSFGQVPETLRPLANPARDDGPPCGLVVIWTTEAW